MLSRDGGVRVGERARRLDRGSGEADGATVPAPNYQYPTPNLLQPPAANL